MSLDDYAEISRRIRKLDGFFSENNLPASEAEGRERLFSKPQTPAKDRSKIPEFLGTPLKSKNNNPNDDLDSDPFERLFQQQKEQQKMFTSNLEELAAMLKHNATKAATVIQQDTSKLDSLDNLVDKNRGAAENVNKKLKTHVDNSWGFSMQLCMIIAVVLSVFLSMLVFIKFF